MGRGPLQHCELCFGELLRVKVRGAAECGWVCPLQHPCSSGDERGRMEGVMEAGKCECVCVGRGVKWFNLGGALKSFREKVIKV